ncbi:MAG: hypothetical protein VZQ49_00160 [Methanobrevibacter sp.]|jgi:hypothetical protein|nr:hypothetical protein [Methanobrevibacter sp.]
MRFTKYKITTEEDLEIWKQLLIHTVGYKEANDLHDAAIRNYDPVEYAVNKAKQELETR